jgi:LSD1 subclass zinc finger protein
VDWLESIVLGIVQGLTEFLPVSSSGHLVVVPALFGWDDQSLTFDLILHLGTLIAVVLAFRRDLLALLVGLFGRGEDPATARRTVGLLLIGSIPAGVVGLAFGGFFEERFSDPVASAASLYVTAAILLGAEWVIRRGEGAAEIDARRAGVIGLAQAVAILPGDPDPGPGRRRRRVHHHRAGGRRVPHGLRRGVARHRVAAPLRADALVRGLRRLPGGVRHRLPRGPGALSPGARPVRCAGCAAADR